MNNQTILNWLEAKKVLEAAKETEANLRKEVLASGFNFDENSLTEGTQNIELGNGYKLKASFKINRTFISVDDVDEVLEKFEKMGAEGKFIADRIVKFKAELSVTEYRKLDDKFKTEIDKIIIAKPGLPSLELVEPKNK